MTFNSGQEMLETIKNDVDLYNRETEQYVFNHSGCGNIAVYYISNEDADELAKEDDYWGAYLGVGGAIYDSEEYIRENYPEDKTNADWYTNIDWCNENYKGEWEDVSK